ncbi:MAG: lytic transglycosylase domain-containing protein [Bacteroidota bacterium]
MPKFVFFVITLGMMGGGLAFYGYDQAVQHPEIKVMQAHIKPASMALPDTIFFCGEVVPTNEASVRKRLDREIQKHVYHKPATQLLLRRAAKYRKPFQRILRQHGVHEDVFYIALAESNLSNAISPKGAKGYWQFMKRTAEEYDLEVNNTVDERFHSIKSTVAAARYFRQAHKKFDNWTLVAASYNMGRTGLSRAIRKQNTADYYQLKLNKETGNYLYRILGIKLALENPELLGIPVPDDLYKDNEKLEELDILDDIEDLEAFALALGTNLKTLKVHNPWLISDHFVAKPGKIYKIHLPISETEEASEVLSSKVTEEPNSMLSQTNMKLALAKVESISND